MTEQPTLVFIHGAGSSSDFWHEQRAKFPDAHYVDLPGHQGSGIGDRGPVDAHNSIPDPRPPIPSVDSYADWVQRYVEARGLSSVVLDGHSMGGAITLTLALRRPAWLLGIVLTGTGARLRVRPDLLEMARTDYEGVAGLIVDASFASVDGQLSYKQRIVRNGVRRQILRTPPEVTIADYEACNRFDVMGRVSEIGVPTLCIVGAQDRMTPPKYSEHLHTQIAGSQLEIVDGAGHMLPMEQPEAYNLALAEFLAGEVRSGSA